MTNTFWNGTPEQNAPRNTYEAMCHTGHGSILVGRAGDDDAATFGAFIAAQPQYAELLSVSGWIGRWTGEYTYSADGHHAAVLERVRHIDGRSGTGTMAIHTCLGNVWTATGHILRPAVVGDRVMPRLGGFGAALGRRPGTVVATSDRLSDTVAVRFDGRSDSADVARSDVDVITTGYADTITQRADTADARRRRDNGEGAGYPVA